MSEAIIKLQGVWKIFGTRVEEAMQAITREGLTKAQALEQFGCVVGIADCSFEVPRGEIFCVMGLSGSGKVDHGAPHQSTDRADRRAH